MNAIDCNIEALIVFGRRNNKDWGAISKAYSSTTEPKKIVQKVLQAGDLELFNADKDFVVFGGIARNEVTNGSDVDWTLLIDGQVDSRVNFNLASFIKKGLKESRLKDPGPKGPFGNITFSHDLVHHIGGQDDTNHNLTQRNLLLLESEMVSVTDNRNGTAYDRVLKAVIEQYIDNDSGYRVNNPNPHFTPRF